MKKIIALLLALMMTFSVATVAFAEGTEEESTPSAEEMLGEYAWILDIPAGTIAPALKFAMFALKAAKVYVKICGIFNLDPVETAGKIVDFIEKVLEDNKVEEPETAPAAAIA